MYMRSASPVAVDFQHFVPFNFINGALSEESSGMYIRSLWSLSRSRPVEHGYLVAKDVVSRLPITLYLSNIRLR